MFNNYQELYYAYIDFYTTSFYGSRHTSSISQNGHGPDGLAVQHNRNQTPRQWPGVPLGVYGEQFKALDEYCVSNRDNYCLPPASGTYNKYLSSSNNSACANHYSSSPLTTSARQLSDQIIVITSNGPVADRQSAALIAEQSDGRLVRVGSFNSLDTSDIVNLASLFVFLVLAKRYLSLKLSQHKPIEKLGLRSKDRERLDECLWRLLFYSFSSTWLIYSCFKQNSHLLLTTGSWSSHTPSPPPPLPFKYTFDLDWSSYAIFMIEASFYLHATYALIFEDVWRRDSPMMLIHHLAAAFTTLSIYATRTHQIGLISTVLRDTCDVLLEIIKLTKCLHIQHGKRVRSLGLALKCLLTIFAITFAANQLYYYPLYCLYHALNMIKIYSIQTPVMVAILTCGLIFLLLDILWFMLILRLLYNVIFLGEPLKDLREYDDEDEDIVDSSHDSCDQLVESDKATKKRS